MEMVAETPSADTVTTTVPAVLFAVNVPVARPETAVAVGETLPNAELLVTEKLTAVPSDTFAPVLSVSTAAMATVPRALTVVGVAVSAMAATVVLVVVVVVLSVCPLGVLPVTESLEHPPLNVESIRSSKRLTDFISKPLFLIKHPISELLTHL